MYIDISISLRTKIPSPYFHSIYFKLAQQRQSPGTTKKFNLDSLECSSPRKSLVKGERFIRQMKRSQSKNAS